MTSGSKIRARVAERPHTKSSEAPKIPSCGPSTSDLAFNFHALAQDENGNRRKRNRSDVHDNRIERCYQVARRIDGDEEQEDGSGNRRRQLWPNIRMEKHEAQRERNLGGTGGV